jgi:hypothetical protein
MLLRAAIGIIGAGVSLTSSDNREKLSEAIFSETFGGIVADWFKGAGEAGYEKLTTNLTRANVMHIAQASVRQVLSAFFLTADRITTSKRCAATCGNGV